MADWTGILQLDVENRQGKSVTKNLYFQGAFKIMRPVYHQQSKHPCYYILNPGGGYLNGDTYRMEVSVQEEAKATLTTQSATKIYKTPSKHAYQETEIHLKQGSYLEYLPDPLIAYKDACYVQKNIVRMEKGAEFLYTDILTPGWSPEGKHFSYESLRLINEIYLNDEIVVFDHLHLSPRNKAMNGLGHMEGYTHLGSLIAISEKVNDAFIETLYNTLEQMEGNFKIGISRLATEGLSIRIMANSTQLIERIFTACHHTISMEWFQTKPSFLRKY